MPEANQASSYKQQKRQIAVDQFRSEVGTAIVRFLETMDLIAGLKNPPQRPPGRPRKVAVNGPAEAEAEEQQEG